MQNVYSADTYFVKYDIGDYGKALVHDTKVYKSGDKATVLAAPQPTNDNMKFAGWSTNPDGDGNIYNAGDKIVVTDNTTLYAQWQSKSFIEIFFQSLADFFNSILDFFRNLFS